MKKYLLMFCLLLTALTAVTAFAQDGVELKLASVNASVGEEVVIDLEIANNPGVTGLKFTPKYDEAKLEFTGIEHSARDSVFSSCTKADTNDGVLCFSLGDADEDGKILGLKFTVKDTASSGNTPVTIGVEIGDMQNYDGDVLTPTIIPGNVTIAGADPVPVIINPEQVIVNPTVLNLEAGESAALIAQVLPANATDKSVRWNSDNPAVAMVDNMNGRVTAVSEGTATITVRANAGRNVSATCTVIVRSAEILPILPTSITVTPSTLTIQENQTAALTARVLPANATDQRVIWTTSDPTVATVVDGVVTGVSEGTATITVRANADRNVSATITVTVTNNVNPQPQPSPVNPPINFNRLEGAWRGELPRTGFSAMHPQALSAMPKDLKYNPLSWSLEIPTLSVDADIVEVPYLNDEYPIEWLGNSVGLLEGFALPGEGYTVLTGHNHLNTTEAGPFALLVAMEEGERIFVHDPEEGIKIYVVYANEKVGQNEFDAVEKIATMFENSLTLITCEDELVDGGYANRRIVAAKPL